jgi:hypothetical protein
VQKHTDWAAVAAMALVERTGRERWTQYLDPANGKEGMDTRRKRKASGGSVRNMAPPIKQKAAMVPGRANIQCRKRWT